MATELEEELVTAASNNPGDMLTAMASEISGNAKFTPLWAIKHNNTPQAFTVTNLATGEDINYRFTGNVIKITLAPDGDITDPGDSSTAPTITGTDHSPENVNIDFSSMSPSNRFYVRANTKVLQFEMYDSTENFQSWLSNVGLGWAPDNGGTPLAGGEGYICAAGRGRFSNSTSGTTDDYLFGQGPGNTTSIKYKNGQWFTRVGALARQNSVNTDGSKNITGFDLIVYAFNGTSGQKTVGRTIYEGTWTENQPSKFQQNTNDVSSTQAFRHTYDNGSTSTNIVTLCDKNTVVIGP